MDTDEKKSSAEEEDDSSEEQSSESEPELMVTTRTRRATAGNRYNTLVAQEVAAEQDEEDEVAMLFAEAEGDDDDFNSDEGEDDADLSSSDDDDQGPNAAPEDMDGEEQIQKEAKAERAKKRKADLALTSMSGIRKKPRIDPTALRRAPATKPSKRKERVSWLPDSDIAPGRTSLRKQTILHRAETHAKLKENEEQRLKMKAKREKREKEREADAPKEMTQADRLAEAERVERRNAKSLNRWEAMEKKRAEEQAAKLAALKERKLNGAVITWYSSSARFSGLKEKYTDIETPPEGKKRGRKPKALLEQLAAAKLANSQQPTLAPAQPQPQGDQDAHQGPSPVIVQDPSEANRETQVDSSRDTDSNDTSATKPDQTLPVEGNSMPSVDSKETGDDVDNFLTGIHEYASMPSQAKDDVTKPEVQISEPKETQATHSNTALEVSVDQTDDTKKSSSQPNPPPIVSEEQKTADPKILNTTKSINEAVLKTVLPLESSANSIPAVNNVKSEVEDTSAAKVITTEPSHDGRTSLQIQDDPTIMSTELESPKSRTSPMVVDIGSPAGSVSEPPIEVTSTRNLVILSQFDNLTDEMRQDFGLFYNNRKTAKPVKHGQELCPVTGHTARYRDPATGIAYVDAKAYQKLQELKQHQFAWSSMLNCYVGRSKTVARGVPDGFLAT